MDAKGELDLEPGSGEKRNENQMIMMSKMLYMFEIGREKDS